MTWTTEHGIAGKFKPGTGYKHVAALFESYNALVADGAPRAAIRPVIDELVNLEPKLISKRNGEVQSFHVALVYPLLDELRVSLYRESIWQ